VREQYNNQEVYFYTGGESHAPGRDTVVFVHGAGMDHTVWTLYSRYWAKAGYNVLTIDLPGHGLSSGEPLQSIEDCGDFVSGFVQHMELAEKVYMVGHSMGSLVALESAARLPGTVKLAMLGTSVPMVVGEALLNAARDNDRSAIDMISLFGHSYGSQLGSNPIAGISAQLSAERLLENAADGVLYTSLNACNEYKAGFDTAAQLSCPVTLILGEFDQMTPRKHIDKLLESFSDADQIVISDCGHMMMSEKPEATHQALYQVIKG